MKRIEKLFKYFLLRILLLIKSGSKNNSDPVINSNTKILFIRLNRIGDALITTPLLKILKDKLRCKFYILADEKNYFVFNNNPDIDEVIVFNKGLQGFIKIITKIKQEKFEIIVDLHDDVSTTVTYLLAFCNAKHKFGLSKGNDIVYTKTAARLNPASTHVIERNLELLKLFDLSVNKDNVNIVYCPDEKNIKKTSKILANKYRQNKFILGINISAGSPARYWGTERFNRLLNALKNYDINILILCSTRDINLALSIIDKENLFYSPSFDEFAAMISRLDMLFTPDTSVIHIASAFHIPVFGLYVKYNTDDTIWTPYRSDFDCVITEEPNFVTLDYEKVINRFLPFLEKHINARNTSL